VSAASGGKFANGALTSAMSFAMGALAQTQAAKADCLDCKGGIGKPVGDRYALDRTNPDWKGKLSVIDEYGVTVVRGHLTVSGRGAAFIAEDVNAAWGFATGDANGKYYRSEITLSVFKNGGDWQIRNWNRRAWEAINAQLCSGVAGASNGIGRSTIYIPPVRSIWRQFGTPAHEFGHALGLSHAPPGSRSIMSYDSDRQVIGRDIQNLAGGY